MPDLQLCKIAGCASTPNQDAVINVEYKSLAESILPGQYVQLCVNEETENRKIAYVLAAVPKQKMVSLYVHSEDVKSLELTSLNRIWLSQAKGRAFPQLEFSRRILLIADELGLPSAMFLTQNISASAAASKTEKNIFTLLYTETQFPFNPQPSQFIVQGVPAGVIAACPLLEDRKIPSRLISENFQPGCYEGSVPEFFKAWNHEYINEEDVTIFSCGRKSFVQQIEQHVDSLIAKKHFLELDCT